MRALVLGLGNDLLGDDAVGLAVARRVAACLTTDQVHVVETSEAGLALLEHIIGYDPVVIVDAAQTGEAPVGTVRVFGPERFRQVVAPSAHYAGLPEVLELGQRLGAPMPRVIHVVAIEVADPFHFATELSSEAASAVRGATLIVLRLLKMRRATREAGSAVPCGGSR